MNWLEETTQAYRRGFVEGQAGQMDCYLLYSGMTDGQVQEYLRGFEDGEAFARLQEAQC